MAERPIERKINFFHHYNACLTVTYNSFFPPFGRQRMPMCDGYTPSLYVTVVRKNLVEVWLNLNTYSNGKYRIELDRVD